MPAQGLTHSVTITVPVIVPLLGPMPCLSGERPHTVGERGGAPTELQYHVMPVATPLRIACPMGAPAAGGGGQLAVGCDHLGSE